MATASKKHHYVPQFLLRNFSIEGKGKHVFVFDKQTGRSYRSAITDAGSENQFNTVELETGRWNFEHIFQDVDARSAGIIHRLTANRSLAGLSADDRQAISDLFAVQLLRTKMPRTSIVALAQDLREMIKATGYSTDDDPYYALPSERDVRMGTVKAFLRRDQTWAALADKHPVLFEPTQDDSFLTSDHPVVTTNAFAYGDNGLQSPGVQIYLPLSPTLALALLCPTYLRRLQYIDDPAFPVDDEQRKRFQSLRDGIVKGTVATSPPSDTLALNRRQAASSTRYLYASADEFALPRAILNKNPSLRKVDTLIRKREMGRGPARRSKMPDGLQLVVIGELDHAMLPLDAVDPKGEGITGSTSNRVMFESLFQLGPLVEVRLYEDGYERRGMREIKIEVIKSGTPALFRVVPREIAMRKLFAKLDRERAS